MNYISIISGNGLETSEGLGQILCFPDISWDFCCILFTLFTSGSEKSGKRK